MNPGEKTIFQEYLTNQGTVVKPYCWQRQNHTCAKCPYHMRAGEEARVPYAEFDRVFGFPYRSTATLRNKHLLFCELRSSSGSIVQKGHATDCTERGYHPESVLFGVGGYLDAVTDAHANIGGIVLYANYSPCNEVYHCCVSKIYNLLWKYPEITLCIYFSQFCLTEDGFPTAAWNGEALRSLPQPVAWGDSAETAWGGTVLPPLQFCVWHPRVSPSSLNSTIKNPSRSTKSASS